MVPDQAIQVLQANLDTTARDIAARQLRRRVFDSIGLYDASLYYAGEALDLSLRALDAGFRILFDPSVTVMHHGAEGVGASTAAYFYARNRPWVALRHLPLPCCVTHTLGWWAWSLAGGCGRGQWPRPSAGYVTAWPECRGSGGSDGRSRVTPAGFSPATAVGCGISAPPTSPGTSQGVPRGEAGPLGEVNWSGTSTMRFAGLSCKADLIEVVEVVPWHAS
jgi:hypothetical protein